MHKETGKLGDQPQMGQQFGQVGNQGQNLAQQPGSQAAAIVQHPGETVGQQIGHQTAPQAGQQQMGTQMGTQQMGTQIGQQVSTPMGQPMGMQTGQAGRQVQLGAHELMQIHLVLNGYIDSINLFELYRPHIKDQTLMQILDSQLNHMYASYQNMVNYLHNQGGSSAVPYRVPKSVNINYGLRQPAPIEPNVSVNNMDDRDVASGMLGSAKSCTMVCTIAALECADAKIRQMVANSAVSSMNQAFELFQYMNQKGMYQVPTLAPQVSQTLMNIYQTGSRPVFQ